MKYPVIQITCWAAFMALLAVNQWWTPVSIWLFLLVVGMYLGFTAWGAIFVNSNFYINVLCRADGGEKAVAISFDDGPAAGNTPQILSILQQHQVPAAFFCIGHRVEAHPDLLKRIYEEGHLIGNHSYSHHALFDLFPARKMANDLGKADAAIAAAIQVKPKLFRPPYGVTNPMLAKAIKENNYIPVGWSIRSMDTVQRDEKALLAKVTKNVRPGDIFLFHDTGAATAKILPGLIRYLREQGFAIRRIDQLLNVPAYA